MAISAAGIVRNQLPAYDPDGDGDNDAEEASAYISAAQVLLAEANECLTSTAADDDAGAMARRARIDAAIAGLQGTIRSKTRAASDADMVSRLAALRAVAGPSSANRSPLAYGADVLARLPANKTKEVPIWQTERPKDRILNYRAKAQGDVGEIELYDIIGAWYISAQQVADDIKALGNVKLINIRVNSDGGDVFEGTAIYNRLAQHPARKVAYVDGLAASIASVICMGADEIRMGDGAYMMIHNAWGLAIGNADEMERTVNLLRSVSGSIADIYVKRTGEDLAKVQEWMNAETWFTAKDAVENGFADVVDEPVRMAAMITDPRAFRNLPAALRQRTVVDLSAKLDAIRRKIA